MLADNILGEGIAPYVANFENQGGGGRILRNPGETELARRSSMAAAVML